MFGIKSLRLGSFRSILEMLGPEGQDTAHRNTAQKDTARQDAAQTDPVRQDAANLTRPSVQSARSRPLAARPLANASDTVPEDRRERAYVPLDRLARLYGEDRPQDAPPPVCQADDAIIAAELRLSSARTGEDLQRIRRSFAMRNHPDRVPAWLRDEATSRMMIANALIDRAMRERKKKKPFLG